MKTTSVHYYDKTLIDGLPLSAASLLSQVCKYIPLFLVNTAHLNSGPGFFHFPT